MLDEFAVEKLKQIKAGFAALQAENEELRAELALLRADKVDLDAAMAQNAEVDSLRAELASVSENLRIANEAWRAAQNSHATIRDAALKDYKGMRRFQELYIAVDHNARALNAELESARAEVDSLRAELDAARWRITELEAANES